MVKSRESLDDNSGNDGHLEFLEVRRYQASISVPERNQSIIRSSSRSLALFFLLLLLPRVYPPLLSFRAGFLLLVIRLMETFLPSLITAISVRLTIIS